MAKLMNRIRAGNTPGPSQVPWHVRLRTWLQQHQWPLIGVSWLAVLLLGFIGYSEHIAAAEEPLSPWDALYRAIQLFVLEGEQPSEEFIWQFEVARFLAPVVAGYTALQGLVLLFAEHVARFGSRFAKRHTVICGLGAKGSRLARSCRDAGYRVIAIERDADRVDPSLYRERGITVLIGDATNEEALTAASVPAASYLFAICGDDGINAEIAVRARELVKGRESGTLNCFAHIVDLPLCRTLREQYLSRPGTESFRLEFFNIYESAARRILADHPITLGVGGSSSIVVVGMGRLGEAVVLQAARVWADADGSEPLEIGVIDRYATVRVASLLARFPHLEQVCRLRPHDLDVRSAEFHEGGFMPSDDGCPLTAAYVCLPTDALSISSALALHRRCSERGDAPTVVARVAERGGLQSLLSECEGVATFALLDETCRPEVLLRGVNETLAEAIHEDYVRHQMAEGVDPASSPAMRAWDDLSEEYREANRAQADGLAERLAAFGYRIVPLTDWEAGSYEFGAEEIEGMARMEHERWCAERRRQGWRRGAERDDDRKLHPDLLPWEELSEEAREKDRVLVRDLPAFLAKAGFQVERISR